jgi:hypothetical protein
MFQRTMVCCSGGGCAAQEEETNLAVTVATETELTVRNCPLRLDSCPPTSDKKVIELWREKIYYENQCRLQQCYQGDSSSNCVKTLSISTAVYTDCLGSNLPPSAPPSNS